MEIRNFGCFYSKLRNKKNRFPLSGLVALTYRCNLDCVHCYCKGSEYEHRELTTAEWKKILEIICQEGCVWLTFTGGEPLVRDDFLELYSYAKAKGFIITLFTNAQAFTKKIINYLVKSPPFSIEVTLNGLTKNTYESITQVNGSFSNVMRNIRTLAKKKLCLTIKTNLLKQNMHETGEIRQFAKQLGSSYNKRCFLYDPIIFPRLNGDKTPTNFRLSYEEIEEVKKQDVDIWREYKKTMRCAIPRLTRNSNFLYHCNTWMQQFYIDPFGQLKVCLLSHKFNADLNTTSFNESFYKIFPRLLKERFKSNSKCRSCRLRPICYYCPPKAYLETGNEEAPIPYLCQLTKEILNKKNFYERPILQPLLETST